MSAHVFKPYLIVLTVLIPQLIACRSAPTRFFTLNPVAPAYNPSPYIGPAIRVQAVHIPPGLDRIEILRESAPGEFTVSERDRWIAPLGQITQQALTADLAARLPQGQVLFNHVSKALGALSISVVVLDFRENREGATLDVSWMGTVEGSQACPRGGAMLLKIASRGAGSAATARGLSALLGQLADTIVAELSLSAPIQPESSSVCAVALK